MSVLQKWTLQVCKKVQARTPKDLHQIQEKWSIQVHPKWMRRKVQPIAPKHMQRVIESQGMFQVRMQVPTPEGNNLQCDLGGRKKGEQIWTLIVIFKEKDNQPRDHSCGHDTCQAYFFLLLANFVLPAGTYPD